MTRGGGGFRDAAEVLERLELKTEAALLRAAADGDAALWAVVDVREMRLVREQDYGTGAYPSLGPLIDGAAGLYLDRDQAETAARARIHDAYRGRTIGELLTECAACRLDELRHERGLDWRARLCAEVAPAFGVDPEVPAVDDLVVEGGSPSFDEVVELLDWRPFAVVEVTPMPVGESALTAEAVARLSQPREIQHLDSTSTIEAVQPSMDELREPRRTGRTTRHLKRWVRQSPDDREAHGPDDTEPPA